MFSWSWSQYLRRNRPTGNAGFQLKKSRQPRGCAAVKGSDFRARARCSKPTAWPADQRSTNRLGPHDNGFKDARTGRFHRFPITII
jgi:hypothetical protein